MAVCFTIGVFRIIKRFDSTVQRYGQPWLDNHVECYQSAMIEWQKDSKTCTETDAKGLTEKLY